MFFGFSFNIQKIEEIQVKRIEYSLNYKCRLDNFYYNTMKQSLIFVDENLRLSECSSQYSAAPPHKPKKGLFSSLFFSDIYSFLSIANRNGTSLDKIPPLQEEDKVQSSFNKLSKEFERNAKKKGKKDHLVSTLANIFRKELLIIAVLVLIVSAMKMYTPFLCAQIISYVQQRQSRQYGEGIFLLILTIIIILLKNLGQSQINYRLNLFGVSLSTNLSLMIFNKALKYPLLRQKQFTVSEIINYSQIDCERLASLGTQLSTLISTPIQLIIGIVIMWIYIGVSFLSGLASTILMIWITFMVSKLTVRFNIEVLRAKDGRMKIIQEVLENVRFIKINALQSIFSSKVNDERQKELKVYKKKAYCQAFGFFLYWLTGPMILFTTFTTYILIGNIMTSQAAFTTIMIFSILQYPIRQLPTSISEVLQMLTSLKRIERFLQAKEIKQRCVDFEQPMKKDIAIEIAEGNFSWRKEKEIDSEKRRVYSKALKNINLQLKKNKLTIIIGRIGCGKSSLLLSILNQMKSKKTTKLHLNGKIAYCSQTPWILSATVQKNIILFNQYNPKRYEQALYYAGLQRDLQIFPKGDMTEIGEKGMNISGGQKARISLARALYSNPDIYLFDDILSAVDVNIQEFIIKDTIQEYLKDKTVVLVTHNLKYAKYAEDIVLMRKGAILMKDRAQNVINSRHFQELRTKLPEHSTSSQQPIKKQLSLTKLALYHQQRRQCKQKSIKIAEELMIAQDQQTGQIKLQIFKKYVNYNGGFFKFALSVVLAMLLWIISTTSASIFMSMWCSDPKQYSNGLIIYATLSLSSSVFILIRASILILSGVKQGGLVHRLMINALLKASLRKFYSRVPIGRIVNRLTKDLRELDEAIGPAIGGLLVCFFQLLGTISICVYSSTPYLLIPTAIIAYLCWKLKDYYLTAQREVTRIEKVTNSPIVNGFVSTLRGLESIRAMRLQSQLLAEQIKCINENKKVRAIKQGLESWFSLNLTYLSFFVNIVAIGYCLLGESTSASIAGLLITYALNLSSDINLTTLCYAYFQTKVISLERIYEFTEIEPEEDPRHQFSGADIKGEISFSDASIKYLEDMPNVLEKLNFTIQEGEKIGIAGRSGSGKTSLFNSLLKVSLTSNGFIFIDGVNIQYISVEKLRKEITVIDQQPFIMEGSLRENLDIEVEFSDERIIEMLESCQIYDKVVSLGGIDAQVSKDSLSAGQRQVLCICRALLRQNKIILIDEATASIDEKGDANIQKLIREHFKQSTVLTIAHRLETLNTSDKILILEDGKVEEFGSPQELKKNQGVYYSMLQVNSINI